MKVAIYARVSSGRQEQEHTVETQLMVARDYCTAEALSAVEFIDENWSGTTTELQDRPAGAALIAAIKAKTIDTVIVYKRDRLGRDLNLGLAERLLDRLKVRIISVTQPHTNAEGVQGRQARRTEQFTSGMYADYIRENTSNGRKRAVRDGKWMSSITPFGYVYNPCTCPQRRCTDATHGFLTPHPENADIVRQMFERAAAGAGLSAIANWLEEQGVTLPLPPGKQHIVRKRPWHVSTVYKMLTAARYIGQATYAGQAMQCPALVDEQTFTAVQQALAQRGKRMTGRTMTKRNYLLRRLVYCRACSGPCRCKTESSARTDWTSRIYECRARAVYPAAREQHAGVKRRWRASLVEGAVKKWILDLMQNPEHALRQAKMYEADVALRAEKEQHDRDLLAQRLRDVDRQEARVLDGWRRGIYRDSAQFDIALASVREERGALEAERSDAPARSAKRIKVSAAAEAVLVRRAVALMKDWPRDAMVDAVMLAATPEAQWAEWIRGLIRRVWLEPDGKTITVEGSLEPTAPSEGSSPRS